MLEQRKARQDCSVHTSSINKCQPDLSYILFFIFRDADIGDSIACLRYYAGWADKILGQVLHPCVIHYHAIALIFLALRALKSITRLSTPSHTQSLLVSAARCRLRQCGVQATINLTHPAEFHGTIPFKCGASSIPSELRERSPHRTQGMESCSCARGWLYNRYETLRNYSPDCARKSLRGGHHHRQFSYPFSF